MTLYLKLDAPYEWVRTQGQHVEAFGEVGDIADYPVREDDEIVGVVSGEFVTTHKVQLPAKNKKQFAAALPYALEESIAEDVADLHFVSSNWKVGDSTLVYVVSRQKMQRWKQLAVQHQLPISQLIPDFEMVPLHEASHCSLAVVDEKGQERIIATNEDGRSFRLDRDTIGLWLLESANDAVVAVNEEELAQSLIKEHPNREFRYWSFGNKLAHWLEYPVSLQANLWGDEYRPKVRRRGNRVYLWPILILLATIGLKFSYDTYRYISLHQEINAINVESNALLSRHFPEFSNAQEGMERTLMERAIENMSRGGLSKGFNSMLAEVAQVAAGQRVSLIEVNYRNDELLVTAVLNDLSQVDVIAKQLDARPNLSAQIQSSENQDGRVIASFKIK